MASEHDIEAAIIYLRSIGRCGSRGATGHICNRTENHVDKPHRAQIMGGADDGKVLYEWQW